MEKNKFWFEELKNTVTKRFEEKGVTQRDAEFLGQYFATVDFYGVHSHGVKTLDAHLKRIERGGYNLSPKFETKKETAAFSVIDGDNAIGMLSANHCINYAMGKAKETGMFSVFSFNNNTYGAAFYYALEAAKRGFICITSSNSPAQMAAVGGKEKLLGTNPFSCAFPSKENHPIVIDMATSTVAKSKLNEYKQKGLPIPEGWALDSEGQPTTDADKAMEGLMLPMAGFKGYGISMMIDIISGVLSGAAFLDNVGRFYNPENNAMNVGFNFTIIDPRVVYGEGFYTQMDEYINTIRNSTPIEGKTIALPGDDRLVAYQNNLKDGCLVQL